MARVDNLPYEILFKICMAITSRDLPVLALVCKSINAATIPLLYAHIRMILRPKPRRRGRTYPLSPITVALKNPGLIHYIRSIELCYMDEAPDPQMLRNCLELVGMQSCRLHTFMCLDSRHHGFLSPDFLRHVVSKPELEALRLRAHFDDDGAVWLASCSKLSNLELQHPSNSVLRALMEWLPVNGSFLISLTLTHCDISTQELEGVLSHTPSLQHLTILECRAVPLTALVTMVSDLDIPLVSLDIFPPPMYHPPRSIDSRLPPSVKDISIRSTYEQHYDEDDLQYGAPIELWAFERILGCVPLHASLESLTLRRNGPTPSPISNEVRGLMRLILQHRKSLWKLNLTGLAIGDEWVRTICKECTVLEYLSVPLEGLNPNILATSLSLRPTLHTLVDTSTLRTKTTSTLIRQIDPSVIRNLFDAARPHLRNVVVSQAKDHWRAELTVIAGANGTKELKREILLRRKMQDRRRKL